MKLREIGIRQDTGDVVWDEPYVFRRLSASGELMYRESIPYTVIKSTKLGSLIITVVKKER